MTGNMEFDRKLEFRYGVVEQLSPLVRRVIAPNPSPFTFHGTGTYIVGKGKVSIIDPGPNIPSHITAVLDAVRDETVTDIVVTHTHIDHSPATPHVKAATGATTWGFGPHGTKDTGERVEEGADYDFVPDRTLHDGAFVEGSGWTLESIHTPGHTSNHICLVLKEENVMFSGDHVMGWSTSVISPPDGNMGSYLQSLEKLLTRKEVRYWPTHGPAIEKPQEFVRAFIAHRKKREEDIEACLKSGLYKIPLIVKELYTSVDPKLYGAAGRSVLAHLAHMAETGRVVCDGKPTIESSFKPQSL